MEKHGNGLGLDPKSKKHLRRMKANHRERNRMHGLNDAMDILRELMPLHLHLSRHQKLSKIETLRLARNYILALDRMLTVDQNGRTSSIGGFEYAQMLTRGLSATTSNLIAFLLNVPPRQLAAAQRGYGSERGQQKLELVNSNFGSDCDSSITPSDTISENSSDFPAAADRQLQPAMVQQEYHPFISTTTNSFQKPNPLNQQLSFNF